MTASPTPDPFPFDHGHVDPTTFREAMACHPAGVVVVTAHDRHGPVGMTATSFVSLSMEPPLVGFAVDRSSSTWRRLQAVDSMVVHLLGEANDALAATFAERGVDRFAEPTRWTRLTTGEPLLGDARSWLRCSFDQRVTIGDHHLVVLRVLEGHTEAEHPPLLYHQRGYRAVRRAGT